MLKPHSASSFCLPNKNRVGVAHGDGTNLEVVYRWGRKVLSGGARNCRGVVGEAYFSCGSIDWLIDVFIWKPNRLGVPSHRESHVSGKGVPKSREFNIGMPQRRRQRVPQKWASKERRDCTRAVTDVGQVIVIAPYGARQVVIAYSCVCVGHEGRPRAAGPRATRVTYTHAATRNNHLSSI